MAQDDSTSSVVSDESSTTPDGRWVNIGNQPMFYVARPDGGSSGRSLRSLVEDGGWRLLDALVLDLVRGDAERPPLGPWSAEVYENEDRGTRELRIKEDGRWVAYLGSSDLTPGQMASLADQINRGSQGAFTQRAQAQFVAQGETLFGGPDA